jgi:hypothetical protein
MGNCSPRSRSNLMCLSRSIAISPFNRRLAPAGDDDILTLESAIDQLRQLVLGFGDAMPTHQLEIAMRWASRRDIDSSSNGCQDQVPG